LTVFEGLRVLGSWGPGVLISDLAALLLRRYALKSIIGLISLCARTYTAPARQREPNCRRIRRSAVSASRAASPKIAARRRYLVVDRLWRRQDVRHEAHGNPCVWLPKHPIRRDDGVGWRSCAARRSARNFEAKAMQARPWSPVQKRCTCSSVFDPGSPSAEIPLPRAILASASTPGRRAPSIFMQIRAAILGSSHWFAIS